MARSPAMYERPTGSRETEPSWSRDIHLRVLAILLIICATPVISSAEESEPTGTAFLVVMRLGADERTEREVVDNLVSAAETTIGDSISDRSEDKPRPGCLASTRCVRGVAQRLNVVRLGFVSISKIDKTVRVDVRLFDGVSGARIGRASADLNEQGLRGGKDSFIALVHSLFPEEARKPRAPPPSPQALEVEQNAGVHFSRDHSSPTIAASSRSHRTRWIVGSSIVGAAVIAVVVYSLWPDRCEGTCVTVPGAP